VLEGLLLELLVKSKRLRGHVRFRHITCVEATYSMQSLLFHFLFYLHLEIMVVGIQHVHRLEVNGTDAPHESFFEVLLHCHFVFVLFVDN